MIRVTMEMSSMSVLLLVLQLFLLRSCYQYSACQNRKGLAHEISNTHVPLALFPVYISFSLPQEDQECYHWEPDKEVLVHVTGSDTKVG